MKYNLQLNTLAILIVLLSLGYYSSIYIPSTNLKEEALCSENAQKWFENYTQQQHVDISSTSMFDYQNHYNKKLGSCFVEVSYTNLIATQSTNSMSTIDIYNIDENVDVVSRMISPYPNGAPADFESSGDSQDLTKDSNGNPTSLIDEPSGFYFQTTPQQFEILVTKYMKN